MLKVFCDGRLFGSATGTAPAAVLALHGWARTHADYDAVLAGLDGLAVDLPGFGATPPPPSAWGSEDYAQLVACLFDELAPAPVIVGHSFGGGVAVQLAAAHPDRVGALVLTGVPRLCPLDGPRPTPKLGYRVARRLHRLGVVSDDRMEQLRKRYGSRDYAAATGVMREVNVRAVNELHEPVLARITCPVELVWGDDDTAAPLAGARKAAAVLPDARLTVVPGAGHMTPMTATAELRAAIERHLP